MIITVHRNFLSTKFKSDLVLNDLPFFVHYHIWLIYNLVHCHNLLPWFVLFIPFAKDNFFYLQLCKCMLVAAIYNSVWITFATNDQRETHVIGVYMFCNYVGCCGKPYKSCVHCNLLKFTKEYELFQSRAFYLFLIFILFYFDFYIKLYRNPWAYK